MGKLFFFVGAVCAAGLILGDTFVQGMSVVTFFSALKFMR